MLALQIIIALAILVTTIVTAINYNKDTDELTVRKTPLVIGIPALVIWVFALMPAFGQVPSGYRGVVLHFGGATGQVKDEGLYFMTPFADSIQLMDVQKHAYVAKSVAAASHDLQQVTTQVTINYRLDPSKVVDIYRYLRTDYEDRIMFPAVQESVKANTAQYEAEKLITNRAAAKDAIDQDLTQRLGSNGITVDAVQITDFKFSDEFEKAIESKVTAEQLALKARNDLVRIQTEADQAVAKAKGEAEAMQVKGDALRNNPELVQLNAVQAWNGVLPQVLVSGTDGGNGGVFLQIPSINSSEKNDKK